MSDTDHKEPESLTETGTGNNLESKMLFWLNEKIAEMNSLLWQMKEAASGQAETMSHVQEHLDNLDGRVVVLEKIEEQSLHLNKEELWVVRSAFRTFKWAGRIGALAGFSFGLAAVGAALKAHFGW